MTQLDELHATLCAALHMHAPLRAVDLERLITLTEAAKCRYRRMERTLDEIVEDSRTDSRMVANGENVVDLTLVRLRGRTS